MSSAMTFAGTVTRFRHQWQLVHPEYEMLPDSSMDEGQAAEQEWGELLRYLGYETNPDWWKEIPA